MHEFAGVVEGKAAIELLLQVPLHPCDVYERVESDRVGYSALDFFHNKWGNRISSILTYFVEAGEG